jgi:Nif-specific regulatory protein
VQSLKKLQSENLICIAQGPRRGGARATDVLLLALSEMIGKEFSARQILRKMVEVMCELLDADRGTIFLLDPVRSELVSVVADLPELQELRVPASQGIAGWVSRSHQIVNIPFCEQDARFWQRIDQKTGYTTRSMLAGPLDDRDGTLIGVVQFLNKREGIFTDRDEELLKLMARQFADLLEETTLGKGPDFGRGTGVELPEAFGEQFNRIIGVGERMRKIFRTVRKVAPTGATILLRGESGTGKGLLARAVHYSSPRSTGPFVQLDCTALPEGLMQIPAPRERWSPQRAAPCFSTKSGTYRCACKASC